MTDKHTRSSHALLPSLNFTLTLLVRKRVRKSPINWAALLPGRQQQHVETCVIALGLPRLELEAVRELGVDKEGELRVLDHSSKTWQDRLVVLRRNFLLSYQSSGSFDRPPSSVLRIDPDSDVISGFGDSRTQHSTSLPATLHLNYVD